MRRLIEQLLDLSRLDAPLDSGSILQPLVLRQVLEEVAEATAPGTVDIDVDPGVAVIADPLVLDRVVSNLVANALALRGKPPIRMEGQASGTSSSTDPRLRTPVTAYPRRSVPRLFDRFERGHERTEGSGLGLAIAKAYANAHGGDLLYTTNDGGALFRADPSRAARPTAPRDACKGGRRLRASLRAGRR